MIVLTTEISHNKLNSPVYLREPIILQMVCILVFTVMTRVICKVKKQDYELDFVKNTDAICNQNQLYTELQPFDTRVHTSTQ